MKFSVIFGFILGFGIIFSVIFLKQDPTQYLNFPALAVTVGGTIAALIIYFSPIAIKTALKSFAAIFTNKEIVIKDLIDLIISLNVQAHKKSFKSLLTSPQLNGYPILMQGLNMVADGESEEHIEDVLARESRTQTERNIIAERVFRIAGSLAPMFGMMGTVIGLIAMLNRIKDPSAIPAAMGMALVTTLYGLILSALVFKPISGKIRDKNNIDTRNREMMILGILAIRNQENTHKLKEKLLGYIN